MHLFLDFLTMRASKVNMPNVVVHEYTPLLDSSGESTQLTG